MVSAQRTPTPEPGPTASGKRHGSGRSRIPALAPCPPNLHGRANGPHLESAAHREKSIVPTSVGSNAALAVGGPTFAERRNETALHCGKSLPGLNRRSLIC